MRKLLKIVKLFVPPFLIMLIKKIVYPQNNLLWYGRFENWNSALKHTTSYDNELIFNKLIEASLKVKNGEAIYERDTVLFSEKEYSYPLLTGILYAATLNNNNLNILDFGGALGSTYYQNYDFVTHIRNISWNIVEQRKVVDLGKEKFEKSDLHFYTDISTCFKNENINVAIFSSSLEYVENPYEILHKLLLFLPQILIFDRTPFDSESGEDYITIQKVPKQIYEASYPCWIFSYKKFKSFINKQYLIISEFDSYTGNIVVNNRKIKKMGFILKKI